MATGRLLRTQISISPQVNDLSLKAALLFTWIIPHVDDFGRLHADPRRIKATIVPMREDISSKDVENSLIEISSQGLINLYTVNDEKFLELSGFERHQTGLHKRTASLIPSPEGSNSFSCSEKYLEDLVINLIDESLIEVSSSKISSYFRQMRVQNCYMDIFCTLSDGRKAIFEIKRQRITNAAINQVINYGNLVGGDPLLILVGCGISADIDIKNCPVILASFEENFTIKNINFDEKEGMLFHVKSCYLTADNVPERAGLTRAPGTELNRTELKGTEKKYLLSSKLDRAPLSSSFLVHEVFEFWKEAMKSQKSKIDSKRKSAIERVLKLGYSVQEIKNAISGCANDHWHMGGNDRNKKYNDISLICRDAEHIEKFLDVFNKKNNQENIDLENEGDSF